jgi:hypothetical protein
MKKIALFSLIALTASVMADDGSEAAEQLELAMEPQMVADEMSSSAPVSAPELQVAAVNSSMASPAPMSTVFNALRLDASALLWRTEEDSPRMESSNRIKANLA